MKTLKLNARKITMLITALIIIGITSLIQLVFRADAEQSNSSQVSIQEIVDGDPTSPGSKHHQINPTFPATATETFFTSDIENATTAKPQTELLSILEEIKTSLTQQQDAFLYFDDRLQPVQDILPRLESDVSVQLSAIKDLKQQFHRLEAQLSDVVEFFTESRPVIANNVQDSPPFRLIAIDRWNNQWNAVIEFDGKITMISPQSSRAGWLLVDVDPNSHTARFRATSGQEVNMRISG